MKTYTTKKKIEIKAGMKFTYPGTVSNNIHVVGYKIVEFIFDSPEKDCLVSERVIKTVIF